MQPDLVETHLLEIQPAPTEPGPTEAALSDGQPAEASAAELAQTEFVQPELVDTGKLQRDLEALLFVASEALSIKQLAKLTAGRGERGQRGAAEDRPGVRPARDRGALVAGGYRFATAPAARDAVEAYLMPPKTNLSAAALETLAIVAYKQPVTKGEVEGIRGVSADSVIATLVDRRFLTEAGKRDTPGRPTLYKTTPEFLEAFGLSSLDELPPVDVDGALPMELALPIPTAVVAHVANETALDDDARDDNVADTPPDEAAAVAAPSTETAVSETIVAEEETEPQPSTEPRPSTV